jgi:hypothetical protein
MTQEEVTIKKQVNGIWKESVKKDFWSYKRKGMVYGESKQTMN